MTIAYQDESGAVRELNQAWVNLSGLPVGSEKTHRLATLTPRADVEGLERAIQTVKKVVDGEIVKPVLFYSQEKGLGKTHLCYAACWMMLSKGKTASFYDVAGLLDDLREGYRISENYRSDQLASDAKTYTRLMAWLQTVHLLVLDDIGVNKPSEWAVEKLDQIVNFRYANNKPLILTANSLKFSDRIVDRCKEGAVVRLKGPSYRGHLPG